jgi:glycosyltransferase involved in cell wall biosynthesis
LRAEAQEAGAVLIDRMMTREESYALLDCCDCYVSLHRSEGLGLTMAEAMMLRKPVIATGYSGNLDFMTDGNSMLVEYGRTTNSQILPQYGRGAEWADPSIEHAAHWMRWVYENPDDAKALGIRAQREVSELLSIEAAGRRMAKRLSEIDRGPCGLDEPRLLRAG